MFCSSPSRRPERTTRRPTRGSRIPTTPRGRTRGLTAIFSKTPTKEKVTVKENTGSAFTLAWTTEDLDNPPAATSSIGTVAFQETGGGLINTDWSSNSPPPQFPILCAAVARCGNSLASTYYNIIWGGRVPVLSAPLLEGASWSSTGGAANDVASSSEYMGTEDVTVPAFDKPVKAAVVQSDITQAGALGDPTAAASAPSGGSTASGR